MNRKKLHFRGRYRIENYKTVKVWQQQSESSRRFRRRRGERERRKYLGGVVSKRGDRWEEDRAEATPSPPLLKVEASTEEGEAPDFICSLPALIQGSTLTLQLQLQPQPLPSPQIKKLFYHYFNINLQTYPSVKLPFKTGISSSNLFFFFVARVCVF